MTIVNIPNVGPVNFPDNMSQDAILAAIQNDILPSINKPATAQAEQPQAPAPAAPTEEPKSTGITGAISDIGNAVTDVFTPSQATLGAGEKGIVGAKQAVSNAQLAQLINNQAADKKQYGEYYERAPKNELDAISARDKTIEEKIQNLATFGLERKAIEEKRGVNPLSQALTNLRGSEEYKTADNFDQLKMIGNTMWDKRGDLGGYTAGIALESLPATVPTIAAAMAARFGGMGPAGAAIMGGAGSSLTEFGNQYAELRAEGMDHKEAWEKAGVKSAVIGLFDAASFKSAGNSAGALFNNIEKGFIKEAAKETGKEVSKQALYGMAGEALGSVAINEKVDPLAVIEEGIGEMAGTPLEAVSTFKSKQQEAIDAANKPVPPPTSEVVPPQPAPGPVVQTADGTPIAPVPLDTAVKATEAKANAPIETTNIDAQVQAKATELGIPLEDAQKLVAEETQSGTKPNTGVNTGVNQPSVPSTQNGLQPAGGVEASQPAGLASSIGVTGQPGVRTEAVQTAEPSPLNDRIQASAQVMGVLQQAQEGYQIAQQEYADTGKSPTLKKVRAYLTKHFTPALGAKKTKEFVDYLIEEGNLNSSDLGMQHPAFDETVGKVVIPKVELNKPATEQTNTPTQVTTDVAQPSVTPEGAPAPHATKGKRTGRPAAVLTPEEAAAKKQAKATQTKEWKATDKQIAAARATLENPEPVREDFKTQDAYLEAGMRYRSERNQALDTLHGVATGPQRTGKLGQTAKVGLDHPSISVQERNSLQQRVNLKKQGVAKVSKSAQSTTNGTHNPKYEKFTTTQQAINHILANGTTFERFLARRLAPFLKDVKLQIVNAENELPELRTTDGTLKEAFKGANGMFGQWTRPTDGKTLKFIFLRGSQFGNTADYQGTNNTVFLHEALHAAVNARIDEYLQLVERGSQVPTALANAIYGLQFAMINAQDAFLSKKLAGETIDPRVDDLFNRIGAFDDLKEFISYGLTEEVMQEFLLTTKGEAIPDQPGFFNSLLNSFTSAIRQLFNMDRNHQSALQDLILTTEGLLQYNPVIESEGVSAARQKKAKVEKIDRDIKKVMLSQKIHEITEGLGGLIKEGHEFQDYVDFLKAKYKGMSETAIKDVLLALRTSDILRWMGDKIPGLEDIDKFTQKMSAMRTNMLDAYAKKADELAKFIVSGKENAKILGNAMHLARLKGITPDAHPTAIDAVAADPKIKALETEINDPATDTAKLPSLKGQVTKRKNDIQVVYDAWERLGKIDGGHAMYKMVRQFYKDNYTLTRHLLDERIERLQELPGDVADEKTPKGQLMAEIRKMQEKDAIQEYFPLMRHGAVWFRENGKDGGFILFDTPSERELYTIKRARELGKTPEELFTDQTFSSGNDISSLRRTNQRESMMLKNMFEIVDKAKMDEISSEELKDQLYQTWLMTLPESSIRKQFLHAENVSGFSADIFRNFTESANRMASQIPRLKFADQMESEITRARDSLVGNPDQSKLGLFVDRVGARGVEQLNPPAPNKLASLATRYAYYMLLTGAASAAVQLVAVPVMVLTVMSARYGYGKASAKFAAYSNMLNSMGLNIKESPETVFGHHIPSVNASVADSARIKNSPTLSKAFAELKERGLFAFTENNLLSQRGRTPLNATLSGPKKAIRMTANIMSGLFSGSERISREIGSMIAFELHYDKTKNFEESIDKAIAAVQDNMGRYDAMERPEVFKYLPVISQFKMYAMNMTSFFIRHSYNSTKVISDPALAKESMKILGGVLMMGAMFHGLKGMPLYSTVGAVVEALSDLGDDDEERRKKRAKNPLVYQNADLRFRQFLHDNFGPVTADILYSGPVSSITDINIGSKTSFDNLWFRGGKPAKTNQEAFNNFVLANIGPAVSGIIGQAGAFDDFENGHIERGLEKMLPAFFKNPLVATRLGMEGAKTKGGDTIIDKKDITAANIIAQATGAAPTRVTRQQELGYELKGEYVKAQQERTKVLQRLNDAVLNKDFTGAQKDVQPAINQIRQFNNKFPMDKVMIDADAIQNTLDSALEARSLTYKGTRIPTEDMIPYFIPVLNQGRK
jgi:hypothetical protein